MAPLKSTRPKPPGREHAERTLEATHAAPARGEAPVAKQLAPAGQQGLAEWRRRRHLPQSPHSCAASRPPAPSPA